MWARVHKLDRVKPLANGGAVVIIEDERSQSHMQRVPALSTLIAIARVLSGKRALDAKFGGKGEVHYATSTVVPSFLSEAITRAGAAITERDGEKIKVPAAPSGVSALIDVAFSELAHQVRGAIGVELAVALQKVEQRRRAAPLDKDKQPEQYWTAVLELAALAGELSRKRGGRWIDTRDMPLPFALKFPDGALAHPTTVAQTIVDGSSTETLAKPD